MKQRQHQENGKQQKLICQLETRQEQLKETIKEYERIMKQRSFKAEPKDHYRAVKQEPEAAVSSSRQETKRVSEQRQLLDELFSSLHSETSSGPMMMSPLRLPRALSPLPMSPAPAPREDSDNEEDVADIEHQSSQTPEVSDNDSQSGPSSGKDMKMQQRKSLGFIYSKSLEEELGAPDSEKADTFIKHPLISLNKNSKDSSSAGVVENDKMSLEGNSSGSVTSSVVPPGFQLPTQETLSDSESDTEIPFQNEEEDDQCGNALLEDLQMSTSELDPESSRDSQNSEKQTLQRKEESPQAEDPETDLVQNVESAGRIDEAMEDNQIFDQQSAAAAVDDMRDEEMENEETGVNVNDTVDHIEKTSPQYKEKLVSQIPVVESEESEQIVTSKSNYGDDDDNVDDDDPKRQSIRELNKHSTAACKAQNNGINEAGQRNEDTKDENDNQFTKSSDSKTTGKALESSFNEKKSTKSKSEELCIDDMFREVRSMFSDRLPAEPRGMMESDLPVTQTMGDDAELVKPSHNDSHPEISNSEKAIVSATVGPGKDSKKDRKSYKSGKGDNEVSVVNSSELSSGKGLVENPETLIHRDDESHTEISEVNAVNIDRDKKDVCDDRKITAGRRVTRSRTKSVDIQQNQDNITLDFDKKSPRQTDNKKRLGADTNILDRRRRHTVEVIDGLPLAENSIQKSPASRRPVLRRQKKAILIDASDLHPMKENLETPLMITNIVNDKKDNVSGTVSSSVGGLDPDHGVLNKTTKQLKPGDKTCETTEITARMVTRGVKQKELGKLNNKNVASLTGTDPGTSVTGSPKVSKQKSIINVEKRITRSRTLSQSNDVIDSCQSKKLRKNDDGINVRNRRRVKSTDTSQMIGKPCDMSKIKPQNVDLKNSNNRMTRSHARALSCPLVAESGTEIKRVNTGDHLVKDRDIVNSKLDNGDSVKQGDTKVPNGDPDGSNGCVSICEVDIHTAQNDTTDVPSIEQTVSQSSKSDEVKGHVAQTTDKCDSPKNIRGNKTLVDVCNKSEVHITKDDDKAITSVISGDKSVDRTTQETTVPAPSHTKDDPRSPTVAGAVEKFCPPDSPMSISDLCMSPFREFRAPISPLPPSPAPSEMSNNDDEEEEEKETSESDVKGITDVPSADTRETSGRTRKTPVCPKRVPNRQARILARIASNNIKNAAGPGAKPHKPIRVKKEPVVTNQVKEPVLTNQVKEPVLTNQVEEPVLTNQVKEPVLTNQVKEEPGLTNHGPDETQIITDESWPQGRKREAHKKLDTTTAGPQQGKQRAIRDIHAETRQSAQALGRSALNDSSLGQGRRGRKRRSDESIELTTPVKKSTVSTVQARRVLEAAPVSPEVSKAVDRELQFLIRFATITPDSIATKLLQIPQVTQAVITDRIVQAVSKLDRGPTLSMYTKYKKTSDQNGVSAVLADHEKRLLDLLDLLQQRPLFHDVHQLLLDGLFRVLQEGTVQARLPAAACRLYAGACRAHEEMQRIRVLLYDIIRHKIQDWSTLVLGMIGAWPEIMQNIESSLLYRAIKHVICKELVNNSQDVELTEGYRAVCGWSDIQEQAGAATVSDLAQQAVAHLTSKNTNSGLFYECERTLTLLASVMEWMWCHGYLMKQAIWPQLQRLKQTMKKPNVDVLKTAEIWIRLTGLIYHNCPPALRRHAEEALLLMQPLLDAALVSGVPKKIQRAVFSSLLLLSPYESEATVSACQRWLDGSHGDQHLKQQMLQVRGVYGRD